MPFRIFNGAGYIPMSEFRAEVNPYRRRIHEFPDRIFLFDDFEQDVERVAELLKGGSLVCEIGSGSGQHLIELAARRPETDFFGFELRFKRSVRTIEKAARKDVSNLYVLKIKGENIDKIFPKGSLSEVYVNFPDPWPKPRSHKHRILGSGLLDKCSHLLAPEGFLSVKTDHAEYYDYFCKAVSASETFEAAEQSEDLHKSSFVEQNIQTEFEGLFCSQGLPIYYIKVRRRKAL